MNKDIIKDNNLRKVIRKRDNLNRGFVNYIYNFDYSITKATIDELSKDIREHFPKITNKHIEIKIKEESKSLILSFYSFDLPPINNNDFEEEDSLM